MHIFKYIKISIFLLTTLLSVQWSHAQEKIFHPETHEIGLRMTTLSLYNGGQLYYVSPSNSSEQAIGFEAYGLKKIKHQNFLRVGLGYSLTNRRYDYARYDGGNKDVNTGHATAHLLTYEFAFGHEFAASATPFLDRFRLRAGISLAGSSNLVSKDEYTNEVYDPTGSNLLTEETRTTKTTGGQNARLSVFGQLGFRITKGLFVGLECRVGPNISYGRRKSTSVYTTNSFSQGGSNTSNEISVGGATLDWRKSFGGPVLLLGIAF